MFGIPRVYAYLALALAAAALLWGAHKWDAKRLQARYDAGMADEREKWVMGQVIALDEQFGREQAATAASDHATDTAAAAGAAATSETHTATTKLVERIKHEYVNVPCPAPGAQPVALPAGVLDALDDARAASEAATARPG